MCILAHEIAVLRMISRQRPLDDLGNVRWRAALLLALRNLAITTVKLSS